MRMTEGAVAMGLVSEARPKFVASVMASRRGSRARDPKARRYTTSLLCPTKTTAPGIFPSATACSTMLSTAAKRGSRFSASSPRTSGAERNDKPRNPTERKKERKARDEVHRLYITRLVFYKAAAQCTQASSV